MAMGLGIQLSQRLSQSLVLSPQMQQSLALLQAPTMELKALVEQELQQNPVLEEVALATADQEEKGERDGDEMEAQPEYPDPPEDRAGEEAGGEERMADAAPADNSDKSENGAGDDFQAEFDKLLQIDQDLRDDFSRTNVTVRATADDEERRQFMFDSLTVGTSLSEFLMEQVREADLTEAQRAQAELIIGNIDDYGWLKATLEEIAGPANAPIEQLAALLKLIQTFDPPGVGARDLRECLLLQLDRVGQQDSLDYIIIRDFMDLLGKRKIPEIARATGREIEDVQAALGRIGHLEPRPGRAFLPDTHQFVLPEVFVQKSGDDFVVSTNDEQIPHLRISNAVKDMMASGKSSAEDKIWIREKIRAGNFLINSLHQRQQTILNIGKEIVQRQREFMEKGVAHLKPLTMAQVAEVVGVHETTVSRAVSGKYMETPQGIFEMKYFFTSGLKAANGENISNTSVKDMIAEIFKNEDLSRPLSDQDVVKMVGEKGIVIARRTVAKYRTELNILPSNLRKVY